jgi:hypothetical protein
VLQLESGRSEFDLKTDFLRDDLDMTGYVEIIENSIQSPRRCFVSCSWLALGDSEWTLDVGRPEGEQRLMNNIRKHSFAHMPTALNLNVLEI